MIFEPEIGSEPAIEEQLIRADDDWKRRRLEWMKMTAPELGAEGELCGDLIWEILLKLPVKSLLRFKQVSKTWMQMITSYSFISNHYSVAKNRQSGPSFFIMRNVIGHKVETFIYQIYMDSGRIRMLENIHLPFLERCGERETWSLMSPAGFGLYFIFESLTKRVALWNPATRKLKVVPLDRIHHEYRWMYGFGHVDYKDDRFSYKVGLLSPLENSWAYRLLLYSSSSDSWKVLMFPEGSRCCSWMGRGVKLNGKYHILFLDLNKKPEEGSGYNYDYHIMTFDYNNEVFGRMEVPKVQGITGRWNMLFRSFLTLDDDECLCLVIRWKNVEGGDEDFLDVWVMREYGVKESWSKKGTTGPISCVIRELGYSEKAGGFFFCRYGHGFYFCNFGSSAVERLHHVDFDEKQRLQVYEVCEPTVGSLVPITGASDTT